MAKTRFWFSLVYKLLVGMIAGMALSTQFNSLGTNAWRLLETWVLLVATIYFLISAFAEWFRRKQSMPHYSFCPLLQGMIIVVGVGLGILRIFYVNNSLEWLGMQGFWGYVQLLALPFFTLGDWIFFTKKGGWSFSYPWYWLGVVISYCCVILLTAGFLSGQEAWKYPYFFLNYPNTGIDSLVLLALLISAVVLIVGYIIIVLDFALSGRLNQYIVMPKIKTIVIEEEPPVVEPEAAKPSNPKPSAAKPALKPKKQPGMDIVKPVAGLKGQKSAQKIHRANKSGTKSKSEIIADMRLQVAGNKNAKSRPRPQKKA